MWQRLTVFFCLVVLAASESVTLVLDASDQNDAMEATLDIGALDLKLSVAEIFEVTNDWIANSGSFSWGNFTPATLKTYFTDLTGDGFINLVSYMSSVEYCCKSDYTFSILEGDVVEAFSNVSNAGFTITRSGNPDPAFATLVTAQALETYTIAYKGEFNSAFGPESYTIPQGANKFGLNFNWPTNNGNSGLVLSMNVDYTYDINLDPLDLPSIPSVDFEEITANNGDFIGVSITVDSSYFELLFPQFPIASFSDIGGDFFSWDGASGTVVPGLDWNFNCNAGVVAIEGDYLSGTIALHCTVNAVNGNGTATGLPNVISIDPVVTGENSAGSLSSWISYFL